MHVVTSSAAVRAARNEMAGPVGLVPTMGALHAGHAALVRRSTQECAHTAASIFVNPTQFDDNADLAAYPRDLDRDLALLAELGVDLVWVPPPEEVYPAGFQTFIEVRELALPLEGAARRGHFSGVATVVTKLLVLFQPQRAYFGRKDAQQLAVVRRLTTDLGLPVTIVGCPTVRAADGLALSSRNEMLSESARRRATALYRGLTAAGQAWRAGECYRDLLLRSARAPIEAAGLELEYLSVADPDTLQELAPHAVPRRALVSLAARVDGIRLIDNILLPDDLEEGNDGQRAGTRQRHTQTATAAARRRQAGHHPSAEAARAQPAVARQEAC